MEILNEIVSVRPIDNMHLHVAFDNGREGVLDCTDYLAHPYWRKLNDPVFFTKVRAENGMLVWPDDIDMGEDDVYDAIKQQKGFVKNKVATCKTV